MEQGEVVVFGSSHAAVHHGLPNYLSSQMASQSFFSTNIEVRARPGRSLDEDVVEDIYQRVNNLVRPTAVVIVYGGNSFRQAARTNKPFSEVESELLIHFTQLSNMAEHFSKAKFVFCGMIPSLATDTKTFPAFQSFNSKLRALCKSNINCQYMNCAKFLTDKDGKVIPEMYNSFYKSGREDNIHLSDRGCQEFAKHLKKCLMTLHF